MTSDASAESTPSGCEDAAIKTPGQQVPKDRKELGVPISRDLDINDLKDIKSLAHGVLLESSALTRKINEQHQ